MNRSEFRRLSGIRLKEAQVLLSARRYAGAYYLAGYAVECALKACIAKQVRRSQFPDRRTVMDSYTHDLEKLARVARLGPQLRRLESLDREFSRNWATTRGWNEDSRYQIAAAEEARDLLDAITDQAHGVMSWLQQHW
jgi:HEPN domain-containing protein